MNADNRRKFLVNLALAFLVNVSCWPQPDPPPPPTPAEILVACSQPSYSTWTTDQAIFLQYPKQRQVFQMDANRRASIPIIGMYDESFTGGIVPTAIEARWGSGPWTVVDGNPDTANRTFDGELADQEVYSTFPWRQEVEVRFQNAPEIVFAVSEVGVGIQVVGEGQSNMVQLFDLPLNVTATDASTAWLATDAMDPNAIRPADDRLNGCFPTYLLAAASMNPELMDRIALANDAPVMYIGAAISSSNIAQWQPGNSVVWSPVVHNIHNATANRDCPAIRIRLQGESAIDDPDTPEFDGLTTEAYKQSYLSYEDALESELGCAVPVVLGVIGRLDSPSTGGYTFEQVEPVRQALRELVGMRPQIFSGPETMDCPMTKGIHFNTDAKQCLMDGFCQKINATGEISCY